MNRPVVRIFQGYYVDTCEEDCLLFVADENCDCEAEFRKAYTVHYGALAEDAEILGVYLVNRLYYNGVEKEYRIQVVEK